MSSFPGGTDTFLFTNIEGATRLWGRDLEAVKAALAQHEAILRLAADSRHGFPIKTTMNFNIARGVLCSRDDTVSRKFSITIRQSFSTLSDLCNGLVTMPGFIKKSWPTAFL